MIAVAVDGKIAVRFVSEESARAYITRHPVNMQKRMKIMPIPPSPFPRKDYLRDTR